MRFFRHLIYDVRLSRKLIAACLLLILVPLLAMFLLFRVRLVYYLEQNTLKAEQAVTEQIAANVESYIGRAAQAAERTAQDAVLAELLAAADGKLDQMLADETKQDEILTFMEGIGSRVDGDFITDIKIYCRPGSPLLEREELAGCGWFASTEQIDTSLWYGILSGFQASSLVTSAFHMNSFEVQNRGTVSYVRKIRYYAQGREAQAYAAVYFDRLFLVDVLDSYGDFDNSCVYLVDEMEGSVAQKGQGDYSAFFLAYKTIPKLMEESVFEKVDYGESSAWSVYKEIENTGWRLVLTVAEASIVGEAQRECAVFMGAYLALAVVLGAAMLLFSRSITRRITLLRDQMEQVKSAPPKVLKTRPCGDEIGELTESYNAMAVQTNALLEERLRRQKERNLLETQMLREQINPHFLYNTLDMISWYAIRGDNANVTASIRTLARFYRLSLNNGELMTTVEREITLLEKYIDLQNRRKGSKVELIVDIPEDMMEKRILQFVLQPIVENSLKHGILEKDDPKGYVTITGWQKRSRIVLVVGDDGVGMTQEKADAILTEPEKHSHGEHFGVYNIYRRLELFYGADGFSMKYTAGPGEGTQVELEMEERDAEGVESVEKE